MGRFDPPGPAEPCRPCKECRKEQVPVSRPLKRICWECDKADQARSIGGSRAKAKAKAKAAGASKGANKQHDLRRPTPAKDMDVLRDVFRRLDAAHREALRMTIAVPGLGGELIVKKEQYQAALAKLLVEYAEAAGQAAPVLWPAPVGPKDLPAARDRLWSIPEPPRN